MSTGVNIIEKEFGYVKLGKNAQETYISNFTIVPQKRIWIDNKEAVEAKLVSAKKSCDIVLQRDIWVSKFNLLKEINSIDMSFRGSDTDLQCIQEIVASYDVPSCKGTKQIGYFKDDEEALFVLPNETITKKNQATNTSFVTTHQERHPLQNKIKSPSLAPQQIQPFLTELFSCLSDLHAPEPLSILLSWLFSTPFKAQIMEETGHFPLINVFGTRGSGKTSLVKILWNLFGYDGEMYSSTQREFSTLKILSSTNCIPIFFDEFKPCDMPQKQVQYLQRLMRRLYSGETEVKGRADQSLVEYHIQAPFGIIGEVSINEPAILERVLPVPLSFTQFTKERQKNYQKLSKIPRTAFYKLYLKWAIEQDVPTMLQQAVHELNIILEATQIDIGNRVKDNLAVAIFGINALQKFATDHNITPPQFCKTKLVELCAQQVCEEVSGGKLAIDHLLEKLANLAERGDIESMYYLVKNDKNDKPNKLYLRIKEALPIVKRWDRMTGDNNEILDWKAYRQMLNERTNDYIIKIDKVEWWKGKSKRCVEVDMVKAKEFGIDLEGFVQ